MAKVSSVLKNIQSTIGQHGMKLMSIFHFQESILITPEHLHRQFQTFNFVGQFLSTFRVLFEKGCSLPNTPSI